MRTVKARPWIHDWDPEDPVRWAAGGSGVARRNLVASMFAEHIGFSIWVVWTIVVLNLADAGIRLPLSDLFLLTLLPNVVGSLLRIPYTFAVTRFGGRAWTVSSALLLLLPAGLLAGVVPTHWLAAQPHWTQLAVLLVCAATSGLGGGNFASSMANISFFFPERRKGLALGLNAAGGNLGVAVTQLLIPLVVVIGVPAAAIAHPHHRVHLAYAGLVWIPLILLAAIVAWRRMDSLSEARSDGDAYRAALANPHTWLLSVLYIGTFGSFIGYSFALPLVIKTSFPAFLVQHPFIGTYLGGLGFLGALVGSLARPAGGWLADRVGGARLTLVVFAGLAAVTGASLAAVRAHSFALFMAAFTLVFVLTGLGNGSVYKLIPSVISASTPGVMAKRSTAAALGIAGAVGALGGALVQLVIRDASVHVSALESAAPPAARAAVATAHSAWIAPALWAFLGSYAVLGALTYVVYGSGWARRPARVAAVTPA